MNAKDKLIEFCESRLLKLDDEQFEEFGEDASQRPLSDFNVGQVFTIDGEHYCVPNPPSTTREEFHALRAAWQQESSIES